MVPSGVVVTVASFPLELSCETSGTPPPAVTWSRDGMVLEADGTSVIITGATLRVSEARGTDSGDYHCSASSSAGLASSSVVVLVLEDTQDSLTEAMVRETVVLNCSSEMTAEAARLPVRWLFNGSTLAAVSAKYVVLQNGGLLVLNVGVEDMGEYTCELGQVRLVGMC